MLKSIFKALAYCACALCSGVAFAVGLGGINVASNMGQPLKAEIELISLDQVDKTGLTAKLAAPEAFKNAGIDYPYTLPKIKFEITGLDGGRPAIRLSTAQPVNEPFVSLLVEVSWPSGKLLREYTFLLDPPGFAPVAAEEPAPVVAVAPVVAAPAAAVPPAVEAPVMSPSAQSEQTSQTPTKPESQSVSQPEAQGAASVRPVAAEPTVAEEQPEEQTAEEVLGVEVERGDTLGKIAREIKPDEVSLERMLVALYRANTEAFIGNNMNRLKAGKILRVPDSDEIAAVGQKEAVREVRAQVADWNAYRQRLAQVRGAAGEASARQEVSGKVTASVSEPATATQAPAREVLKLSKGETPGDQAGVAGKGAKAAAAEDAIAREKALKEAEDRAALLEKNVKDLQKLAELKAQAAQAASASAAASAPVAAEKPAAVARLSTPVPAPQPESSLLDDLLADPLLLGGAGAVIVLLAGGGLYWARRRNNSSSKQDHKVEPAAQEIGGATGRIATPVVASPETGDFTQMAGAPAAAAASDEVDPIGEADLFLTFGRDAQAEEVLQEALKSNPGNLPVRLKLMGIYANRKDVNSFYTHALLVKEAGDEAAWQQAAEMGRALEPANPFYGGDGSTSAPLQTAPAAAAAPSVDFDLGFGSTTTAPATELQGTVVMEQPTTESTAVLTSEELRAAQETPMDFDLTGSQPVAPLAEQPAANADDMVFDVTSAYSGATPEAAATTSSGAPEEMVFDVTASHPSLASASPASANSVDDLVFDVTTSQPMPDAPGGGAMAADTAADPGLTFTLDFPSDLKAEPQAAEKPAAPALDIGLGDISLNLDGLSPAAAPAADTHDERWQEVATKLDLARAYQEMGDSAGAKEILDEVLRDGDEQQRASAQAMLQQL